MGSEAASSETDSGNIGSRWILGFEPYEAHRLMHIFRKNNEEMIPELDKMSIKYHT